MFKWYEVTLLTDKHMIPDWSRLLSQVSLHTPLDNDVSDDL